MGSSVTKAIIAVAGLGTRFLPATKCVPKEMLPVVDKPIIQYLVEEAHNSGITDIILVTRETGQEAIEKHFQTNPGLETTLEKNGKLDILQKVKDLQNLGHIIIARQTKNLPYGNASPLIAAQNFINENERFVYMFGDDMVLSQTPCSRQIIDYSNKRGRAVIAAVQEVPKSEVHRYGIYKLADSSEDKVVSAEEKPDPNTINPPYLAQFGRFVLNREIIDIAIKNSQTNHLGKSNELWLIDQIIEYTKNNLVYAAKIEGEWMTTGDPLRYMKTQVKYALQRQDIGQDFSDFLKTLKL